MLNELPAAGRELIFCDVYYGAPVLVGLKKAIRPDETSSCG